MEYQIKRMLTSKYSQNVFDLVNNPPVYVGKAGIKGMGVFTNRFIKKGEMVCYYDGFDAKKDKRRRVDYSMTIPGKKDIHRNGYIKPQSDIGVGQLINDAAFLEIDTCKEVKDIVKVYNGCRRRVNRYYMEASRHMNVRFNGNNFWFYAIKDIRKDTELVYSYGAAYWIGKTQSPSRKWDIIINKLIKDSKKRK